MNAVAVWVVVSASGMVTVWALLCWLRNRPFDDPLFYAVVVLELLLVGVAFIWLVALARTARDVDPVTFVSYHAAAVLLPPVAVLWAASDKTRWGTGVVALLGLTEAVLAVRLFDIWTAGGA